jgi:glycosyltransferase involved in cell wall biosynthesis
MVDVGVLTAGHDVADARLHRIVEALARHGLSVEVQGLGDSAAGPPGAAVRTVPRGGLLRRAIRSVTMPWKSKARVLLTLDPDVVPVARLVGLLRRRQVVVDVHEDYAKLLADRNWSKGGIGMAAGLLVGVSTRLARGADLTVVADDHVPPTTARRRLVVRNLPTPSMFSSHATRGPVPCAVYIGDLRTSRGLFDMLDAVGQAPPWEIDLVGPVADADAAALKKRLAAPDLSGRARHHGRQPPERAWQIAREAWIGFCLLNDTPAFRDAVPTKLYEYLAGGLAVVASDLPRQAEIVAESGAGVVVDSLDDAVAILQAWAADPAAVDTHRRRAATWAQERLASDNPYETLAGVIEELSRSGADRS